MKMLYTIGCWGSGPNAEICLAWHGEKEFVIGVDLSICIPCTDQLVEIWQSELIPLDFSEVPRPVLVVPSPSRKKLGACRLGYRTHDGQTESAEACWKISTTPIEVYKMRNIPGHYRVCYLVLKWMCKQRNKARLSEDSMLTLSSYMLKNAVLSCQASNGQTEIASCIEEVLQHLCTCAEKNNLPAYFMPNVNLWRFVDGKAMPPREILGMLINYLFKTLRESSAESFSFHQVRGKIRSLQKRFSTIEIEALEPFPKPMLALTYTCSAKPSSSE